MSSEMMFQQPSTSTQNITEEFKSDLKPKQKKASEKRPYINEPKSGLMAPPKPPKLARHNPPDSGVKKEELYHPPPSITGVDNSKLPDNSKRTKTDSQQLSQKPRVYKAKYSTTQLAIQYLERHKFPHMREISDYEKIAKIGQGTFGEVFKARDKRSNRVVALKKILTENEKEGFPITAIREVKTLMKIRHENIVDFHEMIAQKGGSGTPRGKVAFYLVFAFCDHDLAGILSDQRIVISLSNARCIMYQIFHGLERIHKMRFLHRDMKAANILVTAEGVIKLADFGLSRMLLQQKNSLYTNRVVTLWYRPPELLLGERCYTSAIDMWGAGCVMVELWTRRPVMQGDTEIRQLTLISTLCGSITEESMPGVAKLSRFNMLRDLSSNRPSRLRSLLTDKVPSNEAVNLIERLITLDPKSRFTAKQALDSDFFRAYNHEENLPELSTMLSMIRTSHFEMNSSRYRQQQHPRLTGQLQMSQANTLNGHYQDRIF